MEMFWNKENIVKEIEGIANQNDDVLVKGSRGMALEEIVLEWT